MIDESFITYARMVREQSYRLGSATLEEEEVLHIYSLVFTYAASVTEDVTFAELWAGIGYVSLWAAKALDDACNVRCRVVAVEPRRRLAEKASTLLHSYPFKRTSLKVIHGEPLKILERLEDYSIDVAFVNTSVGKLPSIARMLESKLVVGGVVIVPGVYVGNIPDEVYEVISAPTWKRTIIPVGRGLLILVRVEAAGEGGEAG